MSDTEESRRRNHWRGYRNGYTQALSDVRLMLNEQQRALELTGLPIPEEDARTDTIRGLRAWVRAKLKAVRDE